MYNRVLINELKCWKKAIFLSSLVTYFQQSIKVDCVVTKRIYIDHLWKLEHIYTLPFCPNKKHFVVNATDAYVLILIPYIIFVQKKNFLRSCIVKALVIICSSQSKDHSYVRNVLIRNKKLNFNLSSYVLKNTKFFS